MKNFIRVLLFSTLLVPVFTHALEICPPSSNCIALTHNLYRGVSDVSTNGEVSKLQQFLKDQGDFTHPVITGYLGSITEMAVQKFQIREKIISSGTPNTTGFGRVGPRTRARILEITSSVPLLSPNSSTIPNPTEEGITSSSITLQINGDDELEIKSGEKATLTWKGENVEDCVSSGSGSLAWANATRTSSGSYSLQTLGQFGESSFKLSCEDTKGNTIAKEVDVLITGETAEEEPVKKGTAGNDTPLIRESAFIGDVKVGSQALLHLVASDVDKDNLMWTVSWGDDTETAINTCPSTRDNTDVYAVHEWTDIGLHSIVIKVFDCRGKDALVNKRINVLP